MVKKESTDSGLVVKSLNYKIDNHDILQNVSFEVPIAKSCLVLGNSGSGKTTLLSILAGLQKPDSGEVLYGEANFYQLSENERDSFRGSNIGVMLQDFHLIKTLTVIQNILVVGVLSGKNVDKCFAEKLLTRLGLQEKSNKLASNLSVGEMQRLALARALACKPKWLFCDEPTSSLDDKNTQIMLELISQETSNLGTSLMIVTHDSRVKQFIKADKVIELGD